MRGSARRSMHLRLWLLGAVAAASTAAFVLFESCAGQTAECGNGTVDTGEECDDGNEDNEDECTVMCSPPACGDRITTRRAEQCDDGNTVPGDGCDSLCTREGAVCGNGILEDAIAHPEECDDGNVVDGDGCSARCFNEVGSCGDGVRGFGEECDDGNRTPGDGCNEDCRIETADGGDAGDGDDGGDPGDGEAVDGEARDDGRDSGCRDPVCDLVPQCGCGAGEKCSLVGVNRDCVPAGPFSEGRACTADLECAAGLMCAPAVASDVSLCHRFCNSDTECMGAGSLCVVPVSAGGTPIPGVTLCTVNCDLVSNAGCPTGTGCRIYEHEGAFLTDCSGEIGTGRSGHACSTNADCAPGFFCVAPAFPNCLQYCLDPPEGYCEGGFRCQRFDPPVNVGSQEIGYCG